MQNLQLKYPNFRLLSSFSFNSEILLQIRQIRIFSQLWTFKLIWSVQLFTVAFSSIAMLWLFENKSHLYCIHWPAGGKTSPYIGLLSASYKKRKETLILTSKQIILANNFIKLQSIIIFFIVLLWFTVYIEFTFIPHTFSMVLFNIIIVHKVYNLIST